MIVLVRGSIVHLGVIKYYLKNYSLYHLWGHPHTAQLPPLLRSPHNIRAALSLAPAISVSPAKRPFRSSSKQD